MTASTSIQLMICTLLHEQEKNIKGSRLSSHITHLFLCFTRPSHAVAGIHILLQYVLDAWLAGQWRRRVRVDAIPVIKKDLF